MLRDLFSLFPAYAGVIPYRYVAGYVTKTFPRIRGGDPTEIARTLIVQDLFPAYAGVIHFHPQKSAENVAFPRIRGGDPKWAITR